MDSLITAAAHALSVGDPLGALKLGDLVKAKVLLRRAAGGFGSNEAVARARCVVAEAEVALAARELGWSAKSLEAARATLETHGDRVNAARARYLAVRRLVLIGRLDEAERALAAIDPAPLPPALRAVHELIVGGIALRRLRTEAARAALKRAASAAHAAAIPALTAEVESASLVLSTPAARLLSRGEERILLLREGLAALGRICPAADHGNRCGSGPDGASVARVRIQHRRRLSSRIRRHHLARVPGHSLGETRERLHCSPRKGWRPIAVRDHGSTEVQLPSP